MFSNSLSAQYQSLYTTTPNQIVVPNEEREDIYNGITIVSKVTEPSFQYFRVKEDGIKFIKKKCKILSTHLGDKK